MTSSHARTEKMTQSLVESETEKIAKITKINHLYQQHLNPSNTPPVITIAEQTRLLRIYDFLQEHSVSGIYHFTDIYNLANIVDSSGVLSWKECKERNIQISAPGGSDYSHQLDKIYCLEDYVHLSFCLDHPMMHVAMREGRIQYPVIFEIDPLVACLQSVYFSNINAVDKNHQIANSVEILQSIPFEIFSKNYFDLSDSQRPFYQAEILVPKLVPLDFFLKIIDKDGITPLWCF